MRVAATCGRPLGVHAPMRYGMEHLLDARHVPGLHASMASDPVPGVPPALAASRLVSPAAARAACVHARAREHELRHGGRVDHRRGEEGRPGLHRSIRWRRWVRAEGALRAVPDKVFRSPTPTSAPLARCTTPFCAATAPSGERQLDSSVAISIPGAPCTGCREEYHQPAPRRDDAYETTRMTLLPPIRVPGVTPTRDVESFPRLAIGSGRFPRSARCSRCIRAATMGGDRPRRRGGRLGVR